MSQICRFSSGPKAGEVWSFAPKPAQPVGSECQNEAGNKGVVVIRELTERGPGSGSSSNGILLFVGLFVGLMGVFLTYAVLRTFINAMWNKYRLQKAKKLASIATAYFEGLGKNIANKC